MNKANIIKKILFAVLVILCVGAFAKNTAFAAEDFYITDCGYRDYKDSDELYCCVNVENSNITALIYQVIDSEGKTVLIKTERVIRNGEGCDDSSNASWGQHGTPGVEFNLDPGEYTIVVSDFAGKYGSAEQKFTVEDKAVFSEMSLKGAYDITAMMDFYIPVQYSRINIDGLEFDLDKVTKYEANGVKFRRDENTRNYRFEKVVPAKNFDDMINVWLYEKNEMENIGGEGESMYSYSVRYYLENRLEDESSPDYEVCKALNDYGYAAQTYFNYNAPATPVTIDDVGDLSAYKSVTKGSCPGLEYIGSSLILDGTVAIRHYFKGDPEGFEASINGVDADDYKLQLIKDGDKCYVEIRNILATKLDVPYDLAVWHSSVSGNNVGFRLKNYSVLSYCEKAINNKSSNPKLVNLAKALVQYNRACKECYVR